MNILKKLLSFIIIITLVLYTIQLNTYASPDITQTPVNIGVFLLDPNELFLYHFKESLENIQKENVNKVQFTFFDSKRNQGIQNDNITNALSKRFDLFVIEPVTSKIEELTGIFNDISQRNIPFILLTSPSNQISNFIRSYPRTIIIGGDDNQSGILQGEILAETWKTNKEKLDNNKDDIEAVLLQYDGKIEVIITNNDEMAVGAIESLTELGFNKGDSSKYIPVIGIGGLPETEALIKEGSMVGTVIKNPRDYTNAVYAIGMNIVSEKPPLSGTSYKFDETGNTIRLPYYKYTKS